MVKTTNIDKYGKKRRGKSLITGDCVFPFKYKGQIHKVCVNGKDGNWCATGVNPKRLSVKSWAFCLNEDKEDIPEEKTKKKKSSTKINFDNIQILDEVDALEKESGKVNRGVVEKKNANKTLDIRFKDGYKFQAGTPLKDIYKIYKYTGDKNEKITEENFDLILAKITFIAPNKKYNSLTFGHSKNKNKNGNWLVIDLDEKKYFRKNIEDGLSYYISERDYWQRKFDIINFEGFDDDLIRDKIPELSFEPVDLSTCKYNRSMLDDEVYLKDIPQNKVVKVASQNCYDIDELVQYLISSNGRNVDPMDVVEGLSNPIWNTEEELLFLRNFLTIPEENKVQFQKILDEQLAILRMPPYIDIINTGKGKEFLNRLIITGKICTEDYTNDFEPAQTEITRTREYLIDNFTKEQIDKIKIISTDNGLNVEGVLLKDTGASCIHGVGFRFCSLYFTAFIKIRETLQLMGKPFEIELFPGIVEVKPNVFMFCHGAERSNYKTGARWPLTGMIFDNKNGIRGQNAGGCGRILKADRNRNVRSAAVWGFSDGYADKQIPVFEKHYDVLTSMRPQNLLMQFADRPTGKRLSGKLHQVEDCKKTKKNSGKQVIKKTYKKQGRISAYLKKKIFDDLHIYENYNFNKITKVLPKGEIIKSNGNIMKIEPQNLHFLLYNGYFVTKLLTTLEEYKSEPDNPGMENGIDIDWKKVQLYPEQNNLNYDINRIHHRGIKEHTLTKSQYKNLYLKKMYLPVKEINGEGEGVFELTLIENQLKKYDSEIYYMLTYSGITSSLNQGIFASFVNDFKKSVHGATRVKELSALNKSGNLKDLLFDYILKGYVDENYGDLEELEYRTELDQLKEDSDSIDKAIVDTFFPPEEENDKQEHLEKEPENIKGLQRQLFEESSSSKKSGEKKNQKKKSSSSKKSKKSSSSGEKKMKNKSPIVKSNGDLKDEKIADMKARGELPYNGDINKAMQAADRGALKILIRARDIEAKLLPDVEELSPVAIQDEIIRTPSPKKRSPPKAPNRKKNSSKSDSFGKKLDEAIDDGRVAIRNKKSKQNKIFDEIDEFAYKKDSDSLPSPINPIDSPMRIEELDVPLRIEDLEVPEKSSSSGKKQELSQEKQKSINNIAEYIFKMNEINGRIDNIEDNLLQLAKKFSKERGQSNLIGYILDKNWDSTLKTAKSMVNIKKKSSSSKEKTFNVYIKTLDGKTITIKTESNDTVKNIMEKIQKNAGIPPLHVRLIYEMKRLPQIEDDDVNRKLSEFNIDSECTFHLIYRLGPPVAPFKYRRSEWFHNEGKEIQLKKTQKKSSSSDKKTHKQKEKQDIGQQYYGYDDKGNLINKNILGQTIVLYRAKDIMRWSIQVNQVKNRYKITIIYDTKTKGLKTKVYWWNPKNTDSKAAPDKLLQNMIDQGYKIRAMGAGQIHFK